MEDAMAPAPATVESEGATTDEDVHLSPSSVCSSGTGGDGGGRIKILCSFGGRIMPRPSDGALKYVGGETRVLALPRSVPFCDLKKKLNEMFKTEAAAVKYQLLAEDLDVLVSVTCDEDLVHMLDEYDRLEAKRSPSPSASPRFRVYVFTSQPACLTSTAAASSRAAAGGYARHQQQHHLHQHHHHFPPDRYVATVPATPSGSPPYPPQPHGAMSAGNSPRAAALGGSEQTVFRAGMQRVRSTPNLGSLDAAATQHFHQLAAAEAAGAGAGSGHLFLQGNCHQQPYFHQLHQYSPAPAPVPHHSAAGRYDARGYVRSGSYLGPPAIPSLRSGRPVSRGGPPYSEMHTPKKATTIWD